MSKKSRTFAPTNSTMLLYNAYYGGTSLFMKTRAEYINILQTHQAELKTKYGITTIRIFGSVARNEHGTDSDVDLFVEMPPKFLQACAAADYIEDLFECKVDLVRNHTGISPYLLKQVNRDGITVF